MTDIHATSGSAGRKLPEPTFFDPSFERLPAAASFDASRTGPVLLLFDRAADRDWVADAAIAIATGWNATGQRTVLADLGLDDPMLAERIGMSSMEGVVDIFLYGASLARSARPVPGRGFYLISAGTYTPDSTAILRDGRWEKIIAGFRSAGASLLVFVPSDAPGLPSLARWAYDAIMLGEQSHEAELSRDAPGGVTIHAWLTPPSQGPRADAAPRAAAIPVSPAVAAPPAPQRFAEPEAPTGIRPWLAAPRDAQAHSGGEEFRTAEDTVGAPAATLPVPDPDWEEPETKPVKKSRLAPILTLLLLLAVLAGAVYILLQQYPQLLGGTPGGAEADPPAKTTAVAPQGAVAAAGTALPFTVFVKAYPRYEDARRFASSVAAKFPDARFYVTPEMTRDKLYYKVFSGALADSADAVALRERLMRSGDVDAEDVGTSDDLILVRPYALELGELPTQAAAQARADSLNGRAIPAYAVAVPFSDGTERYKVYGGAFEDSAGAAPMLRMVQQARPTLPARLVARTGRAPAPQK
ncbi:MAG TPA: SPOR domain-containing protein [Longimicrobium sp.]